MRDRRAIAPPDLYVRRWGNAGPVVVLLHGLGASGQSWRLVAEQLAPQARILCPDLLGFGRSPWPAAGYTLDDHLAALARFLDLHVAPSQPVLLAGHSTGAVLALAWAARSPMRFRGLVLISLPIFTTPAVARQAIAHISPLAWATVARPRLGRLICTAMCHTRPVWSALLPLLTPHTPADIARDAVLHTWPSYSQTLRNVLIAQHVDEDAARVAAAGMPVRLLHGTADRAAPPEAARRLAARWHWPLQRLAGRTHQLLVIAPDACAALLQHL